MELGTWGDARQAFLKETSFDRTDWSKQRFKRREDAALDADEPSLTNMVAKYPPASRTGDLLGITSEVGRRTRQKMGMELEPTVLGRGGQILGTATSDVLQDGTRSFWWLMNAPQAASNVGAEAAFRYAAPELYETKELTSRSGQPINIKTEMGRQIAVDEGYATNLDGDFTLKAGVSSKGGKLRKRTHAGGHAAALLFPQGFAINTALGLMTPFGGAPGYEAALPSQEDPSKTSNVLGEIAVKYFLGRTGNLLPYHEFVKVRPDVSRSEYEAYKAFKWDKEGDFDLSDGDFTVPTGVLKGTTEGIHGPELQFLGRSLPLTTALVPYAGAVAGGVAGAKVPRTGRFSRNQLVNMLVGTTAGTAIGMAGGNLLEAERRRRNMRENEQKSLPLDPESTAIGF